MTASGSNVCAASSLLARASTSAATLSSPIDSSSCSRASHRSRRCSKVSPSWDLRGPGDHRRLPLQPVQFQRGGFAAVARLEGAHELGGLRGDRPPAGGEQVVDRLLDAQHLARLAVRAHHREHVQAAPGVFEHRPLSDRPGRRAVQLQGLGVQGAPLPVRAQHPPQDAVVDVQLRIVGPRRVLEERGDGPVVRVDEPAGAAAVVTDPGVAGALLQVVQRGVVAGPDRVLDGLLVRRPRRGRLGVAGAAGFHFLVFKGGVQHGDRLRDAERHVHERDVLAFLLRRLQPQLFTPLRVGVRLGVQQLFKPLVRRFVRPSTVSKLGRRPSSRSGS